jgi:hypothetical protein
MSLSFMSLKAQRFLECRDRRRLPWSTRPACPPERGESRFDFVIARRFARKPLVNRPQLVGGRIVPVACEFGFYLERELREFLLPLLGPSPHSINNCLNLIFGDGAVYPGRAAACTMKPPCPPKGAISPAGFLGEMMPSSIPTMPYSSASATRQIRPISRL